MQEYKMLCLDIDGTLLNSHHQVTEITRKAINKIKDQVYLILVSARMPSGILYLLSELEFSMPVICYSGSLLLDKSTNILLNKTISVPVLKEIYQDFHNSIHFSLYEKDNWYVEKKDKWAHQEAEITGTSFEIVDFKDLFADMVKTKTGINKVLCMGQPEQIENMEDNLKNNYSDKLSIYRSKPTYLEIMEKSVSKTAAIKYLQHELKINRSEIIAIGDNFNDVDMIAYAGLGVAMANSPDTVKKVADEVTLSNDEDGVAAIIHKYL